MIPKKVSRLKKIKKVVSKSIETPETKDRMWYQEIISRGGEMPKEPVSKGVFDRKSKGQFHWRPEDRGLAVLKALAEARGLSMNEALSRIISEEEERQAGMKLGRLELVLNTGQEILRQMDLFQREGNETRKRLADLSGSMDRIFSRFDNVIAILKSQEQETRGRDGELVSLIETMLQLSSVTAARIQALSETTRNEEFQKRAHELIQQLTEP